MNAIRLIKCTILIAGLTTTALGQDAEFKKASSKFEAATDGFPQNKFNLTPGKYYEINPIGGQLFYVLQQGPSFLLAGDANKEPCAVLKFEKPEAIQNLRIPYKAGAWAIGKFIEFKEIEMGSGEVIRLPIFQCVGLQLYGSDYISIENPEK